MELGLNYLEWTFDHHELWNNPILTSEGLSEIREFCECYEVNVYSATADNLMQAPIHKRVNNQSTTIQECLEFLKLLNEAGIKVLVWPLVDSGNLNSKEEFVKFIETFHPITDLLEKIDLRIAFETDLPSQYNLKLINGINSNSVGINLDIGNTASYGIKTSQEFQDLGSLIQHVHVKDRIFRGTTVPLGSGDVDWVDTSVSMKCHYKGIRILQAARKTNDVEAIREYLEFCEKVGV